jgi:[FeFe] hydrogenase H-cluster maturation GTPase HydF
MHQKGKETKPHIGIFGRRNFGKSTLMNLLTGQETAIVSDQPGTTTDPVKKSTELPGIGPVVFIDTAGIDDSGTLGLQRVDKTNQVLGSIDLALLILNENMPGDFEKGMTDAFDTAGIPFILVLGKSDVNPPDDDFIKSLLQGYKVPVIAVNNKDKGSVERLKREIITRMPPSSYRRKTLLGDFLRYGDIVLLITPIDIEAPEGRLILPQVQAIRDILDNECIAVVVKEREVDAFLKRTGIKPRLAVCDSSVILKADASVPEDIPLTGFSILLARHKGEFEKYLEGTPRIDRLKDDDRILMLESCTHHVSCDDIGRVKIPRWMSQFSGKKLQFDVVGGLDKLQRPVTDYALVVQCGGCMITGKQLQHRLRPAIAAGIPVTNYGMAIAYMQGVYRRAIAPFAGDEPEVLL